MRDRQPDTIADPPGDPDHTPDADVGGQAVRGAALLVIRQVLVSLVTLAGIVALPLLLGPSDFGLYGFATTVMLVAAGIGDLGLGASLIKGEPTPRRLSGSFALQLIFWIPFCAVAAGAGTALDVYGFSGTTYALLLGGFLLLCLQALPTALLERKLAFGAVTAVEVAQRLVFVGGAILLAALEPEQWSIPLAVFASALIGYPLALLLSGWRWPPRLDRGEPLFRGFSSHWWQSRIANQLSYATYPLLGGLMFTSEELGLVIWALTISSVPALLAPTVSRSVFPALSRIGPREQIEIYRRLYRGLLFVALPMAAALLATAEPLTLEVFGEEWRDGIPVLRLECITTIIGLAIAPATPLLFLVERPVRVKWLMVAWTSAVVVLSPLLFLIADYLAISIAQIACGAAALAIADHILRRTRDYSPVRDMLPGLAGVAVALAAGLPLAAEVNSIAGALGLAAGVGLLQAGVTALLGAGVDPRAVLRYAGSSRAG